MQNTKLKFYLHHVRYSFEKKEIFEVKSLKSDMILLENYSLF